MPTNQLSEPRPFWLYNFSWIIWLFFISYLSNKQIGNLPAISFLQFKGADKVVHAFFYFVLGISMLWGFDRQQRFAFLFQKKYSLVFAFAFFWGGLMELSQLFIFTYRAAEWKDQLANSIGAILSVIFFRIFIQRNSTK